MQMETKTQTDRHAHAKDDLDSWTKHFAVKQNKAIPLQALTAREGSRRLRLPDFKTIGT
jgi:hypothetical protein